MTNQSMVAGKGSFRTIFATVVGILVIVSVFASTAFAGTINQYDLVIEDNGETITITTDETEPIEILSNAGIALDENDKLDIASFEQGKGGKIVISRQNTINVKTDNEIHTYTVYSSTVGDAFSEIGIKTDSNTNINYNFDDKIQDGMVIEIKEKFLTTLTADGVTASYTVVDSTVADLLAKANVTLGKDDYTKPSLDTKLTKDTKVTVYRVEYKTQTETKDVDFKTIEEKDSSLKQGKTKVIKEGKKGSMQVTYKVKYVNGEAKDKEKISDKVITKATDKVVKVGTAQADVKPNGVKSRNGFTVGQIIKGKYTHYCSCATCNGNSRGVTSSGRRIKNGMKNPYYVACNWLPLGSVIKTKGHTYTVVDRGGSGLSRTGRIDIFTPEGHSACYKYGTGSCTIEIIRLGW